MAVERRAVEEGAARARAMGVLRAREVAIERDRVRVTEQERSHLAEIERLDGVVREAERARLAAETARARLTAGHRVVVPEFGRVDRPVDDPAMGFGGQQQQEGYGWAPRLVDYLKPFSRLRVDTFDGTVRSDVES